jgi:hypothetical protein
MRQIGSQPGLIDLPVAVLSAVKQHNGKAVAELGTQRGIPRSGDGVDIGDGQLEAELVGQLREPRRGTLTDRAPLTCEQFHLPVHPVSIPTR